MELFVSVSISVTTWFGPRATVLNMVIRPSENDVKASIVGSRSACPLYMNITTRYPLPDKIWHSLNPFDDVSTSPPPSSSLYTQDLSMPLFGAYRILLSIHDVVCGMTTLTPLGPGYIEAVHKIERSWQTYVGRHTSSLRQLRC